MVDYLNSLLQKFTAQIDRINDRFTSYRLVLYFLATILGWAVVGSFAHKMPFNWHQILVSVVWLAAVCWVVNKALAKFLNIPANKESDLITALILALILSPPAVGHDYLVLAAAGVVAIASKYLITINKSHVFNPAAAGALIAGVVFHRYASWWVGTNFVVPIVAVGGVLMLRKMKRYGVVAVFLAVFATCLVWSLPNGSSTDTIHHLLWLSLTSTAVLFFAIVMLIEPLTSPSQLNASLTYATVVGVLYSISRLHVSPEEALLIGNAFAFVIAPRHRYKLQFLRRVQEADQIYSYLFSRPKKINFRPGQYMEWTLAQNKTDARGNRRYLTISASPTENELMFTIKHPAEAPSLFKQKLDELKPGDSVLASYLAGSFNLPVDTNQKLAFLAGGVGITPFRSMVKYLLDGGQSIDATLIYSINKAEEIAFRPLFDQATRIGLKSYYVNSLTTDKLQKCLPDYAERKFYISGPYGFVQSMERTLAELNVHAGQIITDYFPGYGS